MISFIVLVAFFLIYLLVLKIEKAKFGNILTPFFFLTTPFLLICALNLIIANFSLFKLVDYRVLVYWGLYAFAFLAGGFSIFPFIKQRRILQKPNLKRHIKAISVISTIVSLFLLITAINLISSHASAHYLAGDEFASAYGQGLLIPLFRVTAMLCLIYLIGYVDKTTHLANLVLIITLIPFFLYQVKGIILIPIIAGIIFRIYIGKMKINLKLGTTIFSLGLLVFFLTYSIPLLYLGRSDMVFSAEFFLDRFWNFFSFLFSGILAFSAHIQSGASFVEEPMRVISPIWNALRHLTGWPRVENIVSELWYPITTDGSKISNVFTIFGTLHGYLNTFTAMFVSFVIGALSYFFKMLSDHKGNAWLKILHCFNLSILAFGWFDYYYFYTFIWMFWAICLLFICYFSIKLPKVVLYNTKKNQLLR